MAEDPLSGFLKALFIQSRNRNSPKFISKILHIHTPIPLESPIPGAPLGSGPLELVTPMDRYRGLWMFSRREQVFAVTDFQLLHFPFLAPFRGCGWDYAELRRHGVLRSSVVEIKRLRPPAKHHERLTYHRRCDECHHDVTTYANCILAGLGHIFEGIEVLDHDAPILKYYRPALFELAEGAGDRHALAADHRTQMLVGVVGGDAVALAAHHAFRVNQRQGLRSGPPSRAASRRALARVSSPPRASSGSNPPHPRASKRPPLRG